MHRLVPDILSVSRIIGSALLLLTGELNAWFLAVFTYCSASDVLDGYLARKYGLCSPGGEILDSAADFSLVLAMLAVLIPTQPWEPWMILFIALIAAVRGISLCIGTYRFRRTALLHTDMNKIGGLLLRLAPYFMVFADLGTVVAVVCSTYFAGALEDLAINSRATSLNRNIRSFRDLRVPQ
jgi:CDP-diacylglycerol--glycerol-3-phosphate 3-phosphatidyltransferase